jgi:hypothetical protein
MITKEQALNMYYRTVIHQHTDVAGRIKSKCHNWRVNGKVKTWKRDESRFKVPIKFGLRGYAYLTENNAHMFHFEGDCDKVGSNG